MLAVGGLVCAGRGRRSASGRCCRNERRGESGPQRRRAPLLRRLKSPRCARCNPAAGPFVGGHEGRSSRTSGSHSPTWRARTPSACSRSSGPRREINEREQARAEACSRGKAPSSPGALGIASRGPAPGNVSGPIDEAISAYADEIGATLIVIGSARPLELSARPCSATSPTTCSSARGRPVLVVPSGSALPNADRSAPEAVDASRSTARGRGARRSWAGSGEGPLGPKRSR